MTDEPPLYLSPRELSARWYGRVSEKTLANWRGEGVGPTATKLGGRVAYHVADVEAYESQSGFTAWLRRRGAARFGFPK